MNWDAIAALGQATSALALVFVVVQIRHARDEMRRVARRDRLEATREMFLAQATHPQLASTIERSRSNLGIQADPFVNLAAASGFTGGEAHQLWAYAYGSWQNTQGAIESIDLLSSGVREDLDHRLRALYGHNGLNAKWYELTKTRLNSEAVRYIDEVLAQSG